MRPKWSRMVLPSKASEAGRRPAWLCSQRVRTVGQGVQIQGDQEVTQDVVGGGGIELGAFLGPEAQGLALGLGETGAKALDFGEVGLAGQQAQGQGR